MAFMHSFDMLTNSQSGKFQSSDVYAIACLFYNVGHVRCAVIIQSARHAILRLLTYLRCILVISGVAKKPKN